MEIALPIPAALVDQASALLDFAGFGGIEIRELGEHVHVVVVVESESDGAFEAVTASEAIAILGAGAPILTELDPAVWTENWKHHFARRTFAKRIEVRPPWEEASPISSGLISIVINPGMAFGTGLHETTASCLELLAGQSCYGARVADVGCGSGILAIAAARLGAAEVLATDVDPLAVAATLENILANDVDHIVRVELEPGEVGIPEWEDGPRPGLSDARRVDLLTREAKTSSLATHQESGSLFASKQGQTPQKDTTFVAQAPTRNAEFPTSSTPNGAISGGFTARGKDAFDILLANILAETLVELHDDLVRAVKPGGRLILSGIERRRLKMVEEAFIRPPWSRVRTLPMGDWVSLCLHRNPLAEPE